MEEWRVDTQVLPYSTVVSCAAGQAQGPVRGPQCPPALETGLFNNPDKEEFDPTGEGGSKSPA